MSEPRLDLIPEATATVIGRLADQAVLTGFALIGGTAMALQAGHRRSLDVDLVTFAETLDKNDLSRAMRALGAKLTTPHSR